MASGTKPLLMYTGIAALILGVLMFVFPYIMDAGNMMVRPSWFQTHPGGVVAWFWGPADASIGLFAPFWTFAVGLIVAGLVLSGISFAVKS
jgi:hypothetical protein